MASVKLHARSGHAAYIFSPTLLLPRAWLSQDALMPPLTHGCRVSCTGREACVLPGPSKSQTGQRHPPSTACVPRLLSGPCAVCWYWCWCWCWCWHCLAGCNGGCHDTTPPTHTLSHTLTHTLSESQSPPSQWLCRRGDEASGVPRGDGDGRWRWRW